MVWGTGESDKKQNGNWVATGVTGDYRHVAKHRWYL